VRGRRAPAPGGLHSRWHGSPDRDGTTACDSRGPSGSSSASTASVLKDTDRDGETTPRDARQLGISGPAGDDLTIVLEGLDEILGYAPVRDGRMTVFFRRGEGEFGAIVDLRARKLQSEAPLPRL